MPSFGYTDEIPANTAAVDRRQMDCPITKGVITKIFLHFPAGCHGLARCQLWRGDYQLFPLNPGGYFALDNYTLPLNCFYIIDTDPVALEWRTWNIDTTHDHTLQLAIIVLPIEVVIPMLMMRDVFEDLIEQQESMLRLIIGEETTEEVEE